MNVKYIVYNSLCVNKIASAKNHMHTVKLVVFETNWERME
jgi:hypothetical protein